VHLTKFPDTFQLSLLNKLQDTFCCDFNQSLMNSFSSFLFEVGTVCERLSSSDYWHRLALIG